MIYGLRFDFLIVMALFPITRIAHAVGRMKSGEAHGGQLIKPFRVEVVDRTINHEVGIASFIEADRYDWLNGQAFPLLYYIPIQSHLGRILIAR